MFLEVSDCRRLDTIGGCFDRLGTQFRFSLRALKRRERGEPFHLNLVFLSRLIHNAPYVPRSLHDQWRENGDCWQSNLLFIIIYLFIYFLKELRSTALFTANFLFSVELDLGNNEG